RHPVGARLLALGHCRKGWRGCVPRRHREAVHWGPCYRVRSLQEARPRWSVRSSSAWALGPTPERCRAVREPVAKARVELSWVLCEVKGGKVLCLGRARVGRIEKGHGETRRSMECQGAPAPVNTFDVVNTIDGGIDVERTRVQVRELHRREATLAV